MASNEETLAEGQTLDPKGEQTDQNIKSNGDHSKEAGGSSNPKEEDPNEALERATELFEKGSKAIEDGDYVDAADSLSRALEIRVAHFGELAAECALSYYKYGCALLYKSQEEADPLINVPKGSPKNSEKDNAPNHVEGSILKASVVDATQDNMPCDNEDEEGANGQVQKDDNEGSDGDGEEEEADEDDSDLDLAWKMLDVARAIVEKSPEDTILKVNILSALGEVSMEREDFETSLNDYLKALSILEHLVEPDNRRIIELNFRVCLVLDVGGKIEEAIPYCQKAISLCKSRLKRLSEDVGLSVDNATSAADTDVGGNQPSTKAGTDPCIVEEDERVTLGGVLSELERKLEDLQQVIATPKSISEIMKMIASKSASDETSSSNKESKSLLNSSQQGAVSSGFDSPTISTSATNGSVTHLGVVGRGVKRASVNPVGVQPPSKKLPAVIAAEADVSSISEAVDSTSQNV